MSAGGDQFQVGRDSLTVRAELDPTQYPKGVKVSDSEFATIRLTRDEFHGEWNYVIAPSAT